MSYYSEIRDWQAEKLNEARDAYDLQVQTIRDHYRRAADREAADLLDKIKQIDLVFHYRILRNRL